MSPAQWLRWQFVKVICCFIAGSVAVASAEKDMFSKLWWIVASAVFLAMSEAAFWHFNCRPRYGEGRFNNSGSICGSGSEEN